MLQTATPCRVPAPRPEEIASLPPIAQSVLKKFEPMLERNDFKDMARMFVDSVNPPQKLGKQAQLLYQNPNLLASAIVNSGVGEYNPDRIPYSVYEKMRLDPVIAIASSFIEMQILAQNFRIDCVTEKIRAFVRECMKPIYRPTLRMMLRGSNQFGFAVGEKEYSTKWIKVEEVSELGQSEIVYDDWATVVNRVKFVHPSTISITRVPDTEEIAFVNQDLAWFVSSTKDLTTIKVPYWKCLWFTPDSDYGNVFGCARYKAAYQPWYWYQIIIQFLLRYLERKGAPATVGRAPFGQSIRSETKEKIDNLDYMLQCLEALLSNSNVVIPSEFDKVTNQQKWAIEILKDDQRGEMFVDVLEFLNVLKCRALFVPDKMGLSPGTSTNAASESAFDVHLLNEEALIQFCEDKLNEIVRDLVVYNFPPDEQVPCSIKIERLNFSKRTLLKDVFIRMLMFASANVREGSPPNWVPSMRKLAELLEIPGDAYDNIFLPMLVPDGNGGTDGGPSDTQAKPVVPENQPTDNPNEIETKVKDRNRDAVPRKERTRRDRRARERI